MTDKDSVSVDGTTFTREQVDRQTKRIYEYVFTSPTHEEDGSYGGRVNEDVLECFQSNLVTDTVLEEDSVATMIQKIIMCVAEKRKQSIHESPKHFVQISFQQHLNNFTHCNLQSVQQMSSIRLMADANCRLLEVVERQ